MQGALRGSGKTGIAQWAGGRWHTAPIDLRGVPAATALGPEGSAIVAGQRGTRIVSFERRPPARAWRRLPDIPTGAARLVGVAIDGSGVATLVYSLSEGGTRAVTLTPGTSGWSAPERAGSGSGYFVGAELGGRVWLLSQRDSISRMLTVLSRTPGGGWRRESVFAGSAPKLVVGPFGDVFVSYTSALFDGTWAVRRRDAATGRWSVTQGRYISTQSVVNRAGDAVSAHIHPIEQGNFPQASVDRFVARPRSKLIAFRAPRLIVRGQAARARVRLSGPGPVVVRVRSNARQIVAAARAGRSGWRDVVLPARLTRLLPTGAARVAADTGGHDISASVKGAVLVVRPAR